MQHEDLDRCTDIAFDCILDSGSFGLEAYALRELGLRDSSDEMIFQEARQVNAIVLTKDIDFVYMLERFGPPPRVIWLTCGNTSNIRLRELLQTALTRAIELFEAGEIVVEIR